VPLTAEQLLPKPARAALDTTETNNSKKVFNWAVLEVADAPDPGPAALQIVEDEYRTLDQWTVSSRSGDGSEQPLVLELAGPGGNTGSVELRYRSELGSPIVEITVRPATIAAT
jgi:hypothetical protein